MKLARPYLILCAIVLMLLLTGANAFAASRSHKKAANELLNTMNLDALLSQSIDSMLQLELSNNPALRPFEGTMKKFFDKYMSGESLREDFIKIYTDTFTEKELKEINVFYNTPTGKKSLEMTPSLMAKGATLGQQRVQENIGELQSMIEEEAQRIQKLQQQ